VRLRIYEAPFWMALGKREVAFGVRSMILLEIQAFQGIILSRIFVQDSKLSSRLLKIGFFESCSKAAS
jgi:hypothetical protein